MRVTSHFLYQTRIGGTKYITILSAEISNGLYNNRSWDTLGEVIWADGNWNIPQLTAPYRSSWPLSLHFSILNVCVWVMPFFFLSVSVSIFSMLPIEDR